MGTTVRRSNPAQLFFDARDDVTAAAMLAGPVAELVAELPNDAALWLLLERAYHHSAQLRRAQAELRGVVEGNLPYGLVSHVPGLGE